MEEPNLDVVLKNIYDLYNNPDTVEKEKASKWLAELQKSIFCWKIADQLLQQKNDLHSCYFAAQTMRNKIQMSFDELPESAHISLRDSLIEHISHITVDTNPIMINQLCLALANLVLLMASWQKPVESLLEKFSSNPDSVHPLIVTLTFIPEEIDSRYLRLGDNRRKQIQKELENCAPTMLNFLQTCLMNSENGGRMQSDIIKCFTAWIQINCIKLSDIAGSVVFSYAFQLLTSVNTNVNQMDVAADCICTVLQSINLETTTPELEKSIFCGILSLEDAYSASVGYEDSDKSMNLCRIFTVMAETFLNRMIHDSSHTEPHYTLKALDLLLNCVGHYDFEVAQITFNVWYKLSEDLYHKNDLVLSKHFKPYVERLIESLYKHCQLDSDHEGLFDHGDSFQEFRYKVSELIKDVIFIISSISCFEHMFRILQSQNVTWEATEAALFIMECVARNIYTEENDIVPKVIQAILNLPNTCHIAIRYTSINILGQISDWIEAHPTTLEAILNFLLAALQQKAALASAAANSLQLICSSCKEHMIPHINVLIEIARCLEMFEVQPESAIVLLKGISIIISRLPNEQIPDVMRQLCGFQISHLCMLVDDSEKSDKRKSTDPSVWLDRLAAIYRHVNPYVKGNEVNPCVSVLNENWPVLSRTMEKFQHDSKIMERIVRCIRYAVRCISFQALPILEPLVKQMVATYSGHKHSCLLYLGSILVDEFGSDDACIIGLLSMLEAFIEPTFKILQIENGLKDHPDTVDDFFRLAARFIQRSPVNFLLSPIVSPIIQCATLACTLDHRDANMSVMKFLCSLLNSRPYSEAEVKPFAQQIVQVHSDTLVVNLLYSSIFYLHSNMLADVADVFMAIKHIDVDKFSESLKKALTTLPRKNSGGCVTATDVQMNDFYESLTKATTTRQMTHALQDFCRLFR